MFRRMSTSSSTRSRSVSLVPDIKPSTRNAAKGTAQRSAGKKNGTVKGGKGGKTKGGEGRTDVKEEPGLFEDDAIEIQSSGDEVVEDHVKRPPIKRDVSDLTPIDEVIDPVHRQVEDSPAS